MKRINKLATVTLWALLACALVLFLATFTGLNEILKIPLVRQDSLSEQDVIVVLGGGVVTDLRVLPWAVQERVASGVRLLQDGYGGYLIVTGGTVKGWQYTESQFMKEFARFRDVPERAIIEESRARSTYENALYSREIMEQNGWQTALVVTSSFHTGRACRVFEKQGLPVTCYGASEPAGQSKSSYRRLLDFQSIVREYLATVNYYLKGYL